ncbi:fungal-specific transcription factor domain-containing protein [Lophiotrema nucula]|uniref:Fungal-specific transcription factor domain-containing protein n=1 Tax=Lophiotrema nucula TaxID=690887 RepID=A0A6A5YP16_9PLEO|nr:fungal-specific transcription factor domain-containing protein [Lophiotrema nucula]
MPRGAAIKNDDGSSASGETKTSKRRCVQSACVPCRKRKSKCDGGQPVCATCTAVYKTDCHYDEASEGRRTKPTTAQKRDISSATESNGNAEFLVSSIRSLPETELYELVQTIRRRDQRLDIDALADTWKKTVTLPLHTVKDEQSLETDLSVLMGKPSLTQSGESRHFGHTSGLGLVAEDENYTASGRLVQPPTPRMHTTWTSITNDMEFVKRLLELYFNWSHPFYVIFSRECFYKDFREGRREKYCSPLLVNAILAYACHFTDEPTARTDPSNFRTAGDHFFAEARRLLYLDESPALTTVQALCVMAMREPSAGRDSSGFMYIGRCMRMAVELGLHIKNSAAPDHSLTASEMEVRKVTFWGCFTVDAVWSICIGRICQLPRAAITLDKPILAEPPTGGMFDKPFTPASFAPGQVTSREFLQAFSTLSELVNDNNFMFYAPKERLTSRRVLEMYHKYLNWLKSLPEPLRISEVSERQPQPHIIILLTISSMLYHTVVLHLFRPLLKVDMIHSDVRPREICIESANSVAALLRRYRKYYDMRACQLVITHILLSTCIVHLLYSKDYTTSAANLLEGLQGLEALHVCHYFGARSFKIVHSLAKNWNLPFPEALKNSDLVPVENNSIISPPPKPSFFATQPGSQDPSANGFHTLPPRETLRRESLSMFAPEHAGYPDHDRDTVAGLRGPKANQDPNMVYASSSSAAGLSTTAAEPADQLFWTPMAAMGAPIIPRSYQMSPMDLNNMLGNTDEWDRFGRDGFKLSDTWSQEPVQYNGHAPEAYGHGPEMQHPHGQTYDAWWSSNAQ